MNNQHPIETLSIILAQSEARMSLYPHSPIIMIPNDVNEDDFESRWKEWHNSTGLLVFKPDEGQQEIIQFLEFDPKPLINIEL